MVAQGTGAEILDPETGPDLKTRALALQHLATRPSIICHATYLVERLAAGRGVSRQMAEQARQTRHFDVCELFAFVMPGVLATPTPQGLAKALGLDPVAGEQAKTLVTVAHNLLERLASPHYPHIREAATIANFLARSHWPWARAVLHNLAANNRF